MEMVRNQSWTVIARRRSLVAGKFRSETPLEALVEGFRRFRKKVLPARDDLCAERAPPHPNTQRRRELLQQETTMSTRRPPLPPFSFETAVQKVRQAEDAWNTRDPERVALAYTEDSRWRNRAEFLQGRKAIVEFLKRKWAKELDYRLIKELWAFHENRISVRFQYEWHDDSAAQPLDALPLT
jgi:hypothetical protein